MISLYINPEKAQKNIHYLNRMKKEILSNNGFSGKELSYMNKLENLIFSNTFNYKNVNKNFSLKITEKQFNEIIKLKYDEYYPSKKQAKEFVDKINCIFNLSDSEHKRLEKRFIHAWQVSRTTKIPSFNILINLIELYKEDDVDDSLLIKLKKEDSFKKVS